MRRLPQALTPPVKLRPSPPLQTAALYRSTLLYSQWGLRSYTDPAVPASSAGKERGSAYGHGDEDPHRPPPPDRSESDTFSQDFDERIPSNKAHSTLSDAYQHSGVDQKHPRHRAMEELTPEERRKVEEEQKDVQRHNEEVEKRYGRASVQIDQKGEFKTLEEEVVQFRNRGE
ncbi:hypothetical protein FQN55_003167 [Onygenales sp. PD_40]|nr:hypothetical protein FQN55_003167 [Onygenales sp. PD_40]